MSLSWGKTFWKTRHRKIIFVFGWKVSEQLEGNSTSCTKHGHEQLEGNDIPYTKIGHELLDGNDTSCTQIGHELQEGNKPLLH